MSHADTAFWVMLTRPLFLLIFFSIGAFIVVAFKRWMPNGRIKYFFLITIPEVKRRRRLRAESLKREREFASYDRGAYAGKKLRQFLSTRRLD